MKRMWIGIGLLVLILAAAIWLWLGLGSIFAQMSRELDRAAQAASIQDWQNSSAAAENASRLWEKYRKTAAAFTDHEALEQMDALFDELSLHAQDGRYTEYAVVCVHLSRLAEAVEEALSLKWWSLL